MERWRGAAIFAVYVGAFSCSLSLSFAKDTDACFASDVDAIHVTALLHNNTIEIHSLHTLEIVQVLHIAASSFLPRSLARLARPFDIGSSTNASKVDIISLPLLPPPSSPSSAMTDLFRTPTRSRSYRCHSLVPAAARKVPMLSKTFLLGKNAVYALAPLTLVAQVDALLEKDRYREALDLAARIEAADSPTFNVSVHPSVSLLGAIIRRRSTDHVLVCVESRIGLRLPSLCLPRFGSHTLRGSLLALLSFEMRSSIGRQAV